MGKSPGADDGNRTRAASLGSWSPAIGPHRRVGEAWKETIMNTEIVGWKVPPRTHSIRITNKVFGLDFVL